MLMHLSYKILPCGIKSNSNYCFVNCSVAVDSDLKKKKLTIKIQHLNSLHKVVSIVDIEVGTALTNAL